MSDNKWRLCNWLHLCSTFNWCRTGQDRCELNDVCWYQTSDPSVCWKSSQLSAYMTLLLYDSACMMWPDGVMFRVLDLLSSPNRSTFLQDLWQNCSHTRAFVINQYNLILVGKVSHWPRVIDLLAQWSKREMSNLPMHRISKALFILHMTKLIKQLLEIDKECTQPQQ